MDSMCPVCGEGTLEEKRGTNRVNYREQEREIPYHYSVCDFCECHPVLPHQLRANKREMVAFQKSVDNLLSGSDVAEILEKLNLTQGDAAKIFGGGTVAFSKYLHDDVKQSVPMDRLLRVALEFPPVVVWLKALSGVQESNLQVQITNRPWLGPPPLSPGLEDNGYENVETNGGHHVLKVTSANASNFDSNLAAEAG